MKTLIAIPCMDMIHADFVRSLLSMEINGQAQYTFAQSSLIYDARNQLAERVGRLLQMHANHREDIECCYAGDICAVVGLKNTTTGDTLCAENAPIILESMEFPEPVIRVAIEPKTKAGQEKMGIALAKLAEEDPTYIRAQ